MLNPDFYKQNQEKIEKNIAAFKFSLEIIIVEPQFLTAAFLFEAEE